MFVLVLIPFFAVRALLVFRPRSTAGLTLGVIVLVTDLMASQQKSLCVIIE